MNVLSLFWGRLRHWFRPIRRSERPRHMNVLAILRDRLGAALAGLADDPAPYAAMVRPAADPKFGDYQANCAMPLAKVLGRKPRDIALQIAERLDLGDMLEEPEAARPGFINLRLKSAWLAKQVQAMAADERLGVPKAAQPRTIVIDYSSPNVAKPLHVGHLRSTIIGDALARLFRFLGHRVIADNHLGDWGTQFGILLYGYKHYRNEEAIRSDPVREMARLYVLLRNLMKASEEEEEITPPAAAAAPPDKAKPGKATHGIPRQSSVSYEPGKHFYELILPAGVQPPQDPGTQHPDGTVVTFAASQQPAGSIRLQEGAFAYTISVSETPPPEEDIISRAGDHPDLEPVPFASAEGSAWPGAMPNFSEWIRSDVHLTFTFKTGDPVTDRLAEDLTNPAFAEAARQETAKLHAGDAENLELWQKFMPWCREEIDRVYRRLDVHFDYTYGESFYNAMLPEVVNDLLHKGIAQESDGAIVIF